MLPVYSPGDSLEGSAAKDIVAGVAPCVFVKTIHGLLVVRLKRTPGKSPATEKDCGAVGAPPLTAVKKALVVGSSWNDGCAKKRCGS
jgi:hypothetical protein